MNKIDYENIKRELEIRSDSHFESGGELDIEYIKRECTSFLQGMIETYENKEHIAHSTHLKKLVDDVFQKYGDEENNMIVLQAVFAPDHSSIHESDPISELYYLDSRWNKQIHPVGMKWTSEEYDDVYDDYNSMIEDINTELNHLNVDNAVKLFTWNDSINEYWFGVTAITRDYKYIYFVFREDGILLNDKIFIEKTF